MKILIVDDSPSIRTVTKNFVLSAYPQAKILEAGDGITAEVFLQEGYVTDEPVDVIILDWMMPRLSGKEFLMNIRCIEHFKHKPSIIMLTAETYPEQINLITKYNVSAYVTKPYTVEDIAAALKKAFDSKQMRAG